MPNPTWTCCADPPPCPTCPDSCDFETSYVFDGFALQFTFSSDHGSCQKCTYAGGGGTGSYYQESYSIDVTVTQIGQDVLTRVGSEGNCCYWACGTFEVEWEITDDVQYGCCQPEDQASPTPAIACSGNQTITGVEAVPYVYIIECVPAPVDGCPNDAKLGAVWMHSVYICGVQVATSHKGYVADCNYDPLDVDCGEEPRGPLHMQGCVVRWFTPLVDLAAIVTGSENLMCGPWASAGNNIPTGCSYSEECPQIYFDFGTCGPFAVQPYDPALVDACSGVGLNYPTGLKFPTILACANDCQPFDPSRLTGSVCPCGNWTYECNCRRIDAGHQVSFPNYA